MMMSLLGAATSDALEDGRVVSGVGGQHDFVSMAQALPGGRSLLVLPATRTSSGRVTSNIVWRYGHTTIPRHLRDVVVTEYGVADLRGRSDQDVIVAMLGIADARLSGGPAPARGEGRQARPPLPHSRAVPAQHAGASSGRPRPGRAARGPAPGIRWARTSPGEEAELAVALAALGEQRGSFRALAGLARRGLAGTSRPALASGARAHGPGSAGWSPGTGCRPPWWPARWPPSSAGRRPRDRSARRFL